MDERREALLLMILCGIVLLSALKIGVIGGGGAGADRRKNPVLFWIGVSMTALIAIVATGVLAFRLF
jgi:hypothetical protein